MAKLTSLDSKQKFHGPQGIREIKNSEILTCFKADYPTGIEIVFHK